MTDTKKIDELAALIEQSDFAEESAELVIEAGWVHPDDVERLTTIGMNNCDSALDWKDRAEAAEAKIARIEALRDAEIADQIERRVRAARGDVRCLDCNLRYAERQEYGCHESGRGHSYDEGDLVAAEQIARSVEHVTLSVADLNAALAETQS